MKPKSVAIFAILAALCAPIAASAQDQKPTGLYLVASAEARFGEDRYRGNFVIDGEVGAIFLAPVDGGTPKVLPLDSPNNLFRALADRRLAEFWPAIEKWAGPNIGRLRLTMVDHARRSYEAGGNRWPSNTTEAVVRGKVRGLLNYTSILSQTGQDVAALQLLLAARKDMLLSKDWQRIEWVAVTTRIAWLQHRLGLIDTALATLEDGANRLGTTNQDFYALNLEINRAAILAETGHYAEALALIERTDARFGAAPQKSKGGGQKVEGSDRHFAWIRACALHGLGRTEEADREIARISGKPIVDRAFRQESDQQILTRAAFCMRDTAMLKRVDLAILADESWDSEYPSYLQPEYRDPLRDETVAAAVRNDAEVQAAFAKRWRILPPSIIEGLSGWSAKAADADALKS